MKILKSVDMQLDVRISFLTCSPDNPVTQSGLAIRDLQPIQLAVGSLVASSGSMVIQGGKSWEIRTDQTHK